MNEPKEIKCAVHGIQYALQDGNCPQCRDTPVREVKQPPTDLYTVRKLEDLREGQVKIAELLEHMTEQNEIIIELLKRT